MYCLTLALFWLCWTSAPKIRWISYFQFCLKLLDQQIIQIITNQFSELRNRWRGTICIFLEYIRLKSCLSVFLDIYIRAGTLSYCVIFLILFIVLARVILRDCAFLYTGLFYYYITSLGVRKLKSSQLKTSWAMFMSGFSTWFLYLWKRYVDKNSECCRIFATILSVLNYI